MDASMLSALMLSSMSGSSNSFGGGVEDVLTSILLYLLMNSGGEVSSASSASSYSSGTSIPQSTADSIYRPYGAASSASSQGATASAASSYLPGTAYSIDQGNVPAAYQQIVQSALTRLGDPYSQSKAGQEDYTDCSYLSRWCYREIGVEIPRTAAAQAKYCVDNGLTVNKEDLRPGDLIFFSLYDNDRYMDITHVGIYAGNGMMVDASSSNGQVVYRPVFGGQVLYGRPNAS